LLKLDEEDQKLTVKLISGILVERKEELAILSPEELYSIVVGHIRAQNRESELLYLIEPHILSKAD
jgi:hypothetical protein